MKRHSQIAATALFAILAAAQTVGVRTPPGTAQVDREASAVVSSVQEKLKALPAEEKRQLSEALRQLSAGRPSVGLDELLSADPKRMTLAEKNDFLQRTQRIQQAADPSLGVAPASGVTVASLVEAYKSSAPLTDAESARLATTVSNLPAKTRSIGRFLYLDPITGNWRSVGTVFVIAPNVVATACHVIAGVSDVAGGQVVLRRGISAAVEFSDAPLPKTGPLPAGVKTYPVVKLLGAGSAKGCDAAVLQTAGAEAIPPLSLGRGQTPPKRLLVVGYPQLSDLNAEMCDLPDDTIKFFCRFRAANPGAAKVVSPGAYQTSNTHDGIGVITYTSNTRIGQSGSPVLDLETLRVVGVHYCCTGGAESVSVLACATWHPQNVKWNEAIALATLSADSSLRAYFPSMP